MNSLARSRWKAEFRGAGCSRQFTAKFEWNPENGNQMRRTSVPGGLEEGLSAAAICSLGALSSKAGLCNVCETMGSAVI